MDRTETTDIRCPGCAGPAHATVEWTDQGFDTPHGEVTGFRCPQGCDVDLGTVRTMIGAQ